ncbi:unnamed protein product [Arabidopsis lyrata]|uniref:Uncharacterized protein n=1 Tax=Arabidopsis lyrata subsp. lyrata TaxID=81972 RepID=D7KCL0_ARALL|nr:hypothetical protein ARALYDRAFT_888882 [Arabidopsis lyrata subsp. lyrata]CAH8252362.1 unnamed protein product [Arabidopsis lyrata]
MSDLSVATKSKTVEEDGAAAETAIEERWSLYEAYNESLWRRNSRRRPKRGGTADQW